MLVVIFSTVYAQDTLYALKGGILAHSTGPVSSGKEDGVDLNGEVLFNKRVLKGYPAVGADVNLNGNTSFLYGGLAWEGRLFKHLLLGGFLGLAIHNGDLDSENDDMRQLGTRVLIREAVDIGFYLRDDLVASIMYDHYSNTGLGESRNEGNDNIGIRLAYYF